MDAIKITDLERLRILAIYIGHPAIMTDHNGTSIKGILAEVGAIHTHPMGMVKIRLDDKGPTVFSGIPGQCTVLLKDLSKVTDVIAKDASDLAINWFDSEDKPEIWHTPQNGYYVIESWLGENYNTPMRGEESLQVSDFLRARGYALPYGEWCVGDLINAGIYKLIKTEA